MPLTYTKRVEIMQKKLRELDQEDEAVIELAKTLSGLRKYSDVAEIVGHTKNPNKGVFSDATPPKERTMFNQFRATLADAQDSLVDLVQKQTQVDLTNVLQDVFDGRVKEDVIYNNGPRHGQ